MLKSTSVVPIDLNDKKKGRIITQIKAIPPETSAVKIQEGKKYYEVVEEVLRDSDYKVTSEYSEKRRCIIQ